MAESDFFTAGASAAGALVASFLSEALTGAAPITVTRTAKTNDFITLIVFSLDR